MKLMMYTLTLIPEIIIHYKYVNLHVTGYLKYTNRHLIEIDKLLNNYTLHHWQRNTTSIQR